MARTQLIQRPAHVPLPRPPPLVVLGKPWDTSKHPKATIIDHFAGIGGATTGARRALERLGYRLGDNARLIAVNHDPDAVASHALNHPEAEHHCCPLESLEPRLAVLGHVCEECKDLVITTPCPATGAVGDRVTVLITCAPCQDWSGAGLGPYRRPQLRATPDFSRRWRRILRPLFVIEENVDRIRKLWHGWRTHLRGYEDDGYRHEERVLNAADYGTPQDRRRLIVMATARDWFGDLPIAWPNKTHSRDGKEPGTEPWLGAIDCLDLTEWAPSFFEGKKDPQGCPTGEPYAQNVRDRIARHIREQGRFWEPLARAVETFSGKVPLRVMLEACPEAEWPRWVARDETGHIVLTGHEFLVSQWSGGECRTAQHPSMTVATAGYVRLAQIRCIVPPRGPNGGPCANAPYDVQEPSHAALAGKRHGCFAEARVEVFGLPPLRSKDGEWNGSRDLRKPSWTVLADASSRGHFVEVRFQAIEPVILPHHGEDKKRGQKPRIHPVSGAAPTVPASRRLDAAFPFIYTYNGESQADDALGPSTTVTTVPRHYVCVVRLDDLYADLGYRQLTVRETLPIQGFARDVKLVGSLRAQQRGIGNALPPPLAEACIFAVLSMKGVRRPNLEDFGPARASSDGIGLR